MKAFIRFLLIHLCFFAALNGMYSQEVKIPTDTTKLLSIETKDGNEFIGHVREVNLDHVIFKTDKFGEIRISKADVRAVRQVADTQIVEGQYWTNDANATRYLFGPNGYGLRKGEGYYQNTWIFFNQFSYGITNNFTLGAGIIPLFIFAGAPTPVWVTPKFSFPIKRDQLNLAVGGLFAVVLGEDHSSFGVAYGQMTFGPRGRNVNIGVGYGYAGTSWANTPTLSLSGIYRTGPKFALVSENYLFDAGDESVGLLSFGTRFIGKKISIDAALIIPAIGFDGELIGIPWLGLTVPFGSPME